MVTWDRVYIWGFSYLDYFFDVLISWIHRLSLYNWFWHFHMLVWLFTTLFLCLFSDSILSIHECCMCTPLGFILPLVWVVLWLPWTFMFRSWGLDWSGALRRRSSFSREAGRLVAASPVPDSLFGSLISLQLVSNPFVMFIL